MKKFILLSLFGLLTMGLTTAAYAQQVVVPSSSIQRPEDVGQRAHTNVRWLAQLVAPELPPVSGLFYETPASLGCIYKLVSPRVPGCNPNTVTSNPTGGSKAIAIVDAYDAPYAASDLQAFSTQFGLPFSPSQFQVVYASGSKPNYDAGWEMEELLDIEWAHAMAPDANIYLVEAASNSFTDLMTAVGVANTLLTAAGGGEVSMSWGGLEFFGVC
jgi:subtilase family serine protease